MVFIKINAKLRELIQYYKQQNLKPSLPDELKLGEFLDYEYVQLLVNGLNKSGYKEKLYLHQLVTSENTFYSTEIDSIEAERNEQRNPELESFRKKLIAQKQERDYQKMIANIKGNVVKKGVFGGEQVKDIGQSVSMGINYIVTLFGGALSGYFVGKYFLQVEEQKCLILAAIFLVMTLVMETCLFILKTTDFRKKPRQKMKKN